MSEVTWMRYSRKGSKWPEHQKTNSSVSDNPYVAGAIAYNFSETIQLQSAGLGFVLRQPHSRVYF